MRRHCQLELNCQNTCVGNQRIINTSWGWEELSAEVLEVILLLVYIISSLVLEIRYSVGTRGLSMDLDLDVVFL